MTASTNVLQTSLTQQLGAAAADPCIMVIFGASGDLTKRLLMPAMYNLECDGLLPERFAIIGTAMDNLTSEEFRERMSKDIRTFSTRKEFDPKVWDKFVKKLHYTPGKFDDTAAYAKLSELTTKLDRELQIGGNILFYMATPPSVFGLISDNLEKAGFKGDADTKGWRRIIVEKPFGHDLKSAIVLNREILKYWSEDQIFRIDHYLGKETVQNILAFRFSNGIFEPLWNKNHIDHIQFTVSESVGVEGRGNYYDRSGVLRDMIQNHMFQMLAYLCMEPPSSFGSDAIRNEKSKVLEAVRVFTPEEVEQNVVRGQYGPGHKADGSPTCGYREEADVPKQSWTETFAAMKLFIDNWRWEGVPIYLRSGKSLWKRGTEIVVQFKKAPEVIFRGTACEQLEPNRLIFHIQPDQGIELRFQAKTPGPTMQLQKVNMRFSYGETFKASRGTGYEVLVYQCMTGDSTLFSRTDLVETAWRVAQPLLDYWTTHEPTEYPNYGAGTWGPKKSYDLIENDGRRWVEILSRDVLDKIPLFHGTDPLFLNSLLMALKPDVASEGDVIIREGDIGNEMYILARGSVDVVDSAGKVLKTLGDGTFFGEIGLITSQPRNATVKATTGCDFFMLDKAEFVRVLKDYPQFAQKILDTAKERYKIEAKASEVFGDEVSSQMSSINPG